MTGDTPDTVAVALPTGLLLTPATFACLARHPSVAGQVLTVACLKGHRLPDGARPPAPSGVLAANN